MEYSERLSQIIERSGDSIPVFAQNCGKSKNQVYTYLNGAQLPGMDFFMKMKKSYPWVPLEWLISEEGGFFINDDAVENSLGVQQSRVDYGDRTPGKDMTPDETALIHTLRLCGEEYKKRVYIAATVRAQNVIEKRKLETKEKLKAQEDLETLSTAAIE